MSYSFAIQRGYQDRGVTAIAGVCRSIRYVADPQLVFSNEVPIGSVEWVEAALGRVVSPNYFPEFLQDHIHRRWRFSNTWPRNERCFIKPADRHKKWDAFIHDGNGYRGKKKGPYVISEVRRFANEFRYYVANGRVISGWWYWGDTLDDAQVHRGADPPDAPELPKDIRWPEHFCGAVDFGELYDTSAKDNRGQLALIEVNAPMACGWYGEQSEAKDYASFLYHGWQSLQIEGDYSIHDY